MKTPLKHPAVVSVLVALVVLGAGYWTWNQLDLGPKWTISRNVDDLVHARRIDGAVAALEETPRGPTIEALKEALASDEGTPWGKVQVLKLLSDFKETRAVMRAIDSDVLTTKRAAAYLRQTDSSQRDTVAAVAVAWLKDTGAADRQFAAMVLRTIDRREAIPDMVAILEAEGRNEESAAVIVQVLESLGYFKPEGIAATAMAIAADTSLQAAVRSKALKALTVLDDTPREELRKLLTEIARDEGTESTFRGNAVALLSWKQNMTPAASQIFLDILLDEDNGSLEKQLLQRRALSALVATYPLDKLGELFLDRRLYKHPYFGIRTDVACGIGALRLDSRLAKQILVDMVAEDDRADLLTNVPRQAWLSFWMITGVHTGSSNPALFKLPPRKLEDEETLRAKLLNIQHSIPGITPAMTQALSPFTVTIKDNVLRDKDPGAFRDIWNEKLEKRKGIAQILREQIR